MLEILRDSPRSLFWALLIHLLLIALLVINLDWRSRPQMAQSKDKVVQAVVMDEARVEEEIARLKASERSQVDAAEKERRRVQKELEAARAAKVKEQKRLEDVRRQREVAVKAQKKEKQRLAILAEKRKKAEAAEKKRKLVEAQKRKRELEARKVAEAEKKKKLAEDKKRKAEAAKKKKAEEARRKKAEAEEKRKAEARRKAEAARKKQESEERERQAQQVVGRYAALIRDRVTRAWIRPQGAPTGLSCKLRVRILPGGEVGSVAVVRSSGHAAFDRSVQTALYKAAPLPLPRDASLAERFRETDFEFDPD